MAGMNFNLPALTDAYSAVLSEIRDHVVALALCLDPQYPATLGTVANTPTGAKRINTSVLGGAIIEQYNGTSWAEVTMAYLKNLAPTTYGSLLVAGSLGGYAGFQFTSGTKVRNLMVRDTDGLSGLYNVTDAAWVWQFDGNGALQAGSVPWAHVTGAPTITGLTAATAATNNTVAQRTSAGYLYATYHNQSSSSTENPAIGAVFVENTGADGFMRKASWSFFNGLLTPTWANISGKPTVVSAFTNDAGYVTSSVVSGYASLSSAPTFSGLVKGRGGGLGMGQIIVQNGGSPPAMSPGDICYIY